MLAVFILSLIFGPFLVVFGVLAVALVSLVTFGHRLAKQYGARAKHALLVQKGVVRVR